MKKFISCVLTIILVLVYAIPTELFCEARLIVKLRPQSSILSLTWENTLFELAKDYGAKSERLLPSTPELQTKDGSEFDRTRYYILVISDSMQIDQILGDLAASGSVEWAEPDYPVMLLGVPNDPLFVRQWYLDNTGQEYYAVDRYVGSNNDTLRMKTGTAGADIRLVQARDKTGVKVRPLVAIIDTGLDLRHPDIAANLWTNSGEIPANGIDDDHNGLIDDVRGWDFSGDVSQIFNIAGDNDVTDQLGHGTLVAGLACAVSDNQIGIAGVASNPQVVAMKMFPNGFTSIGIQAIYYAVDLGAEVINISWGSFFPSRGLEEAFDYARKHNVIMVTAIGNFGDSTKIYPAALPTAFTVGATDSHDHVAYFSSFGSWIDLVAPGQDILSLRGYGLDLYANQGEPGIRIIDEDYYLADGTSVAAPIVVGAIAEILSFSPGLSSDSVEKVLTLSADDLVDPYGNGSVMTGKDVFSGWGRLNFKNALDLISGRLTKLSFLGWRGLVEGSLAVIGTAYSEYGENFALYIYPAADAILPLPCATGIANISNDTLALFDSWGQPGRYKIRLQVGENLCVREVCYAPEPRIDITYPADGDTVRGVLNLRGTVAAPGFLDYLVEAYPTADSLHRDTLIYSSAYVADSVIATYQFEGNKEREFTFGIIMRTMAGQYVKKLSVQVSNGFSPGLPRRLKANQNYGPAIYDLDGNGRQEFVVGSGSGITAYNHLGEFEPGQWSRFPKEDADGPPAVGDINGDGRGEVGYVSAGLLNLVSFDGYPLKGFPKPIRTDKMLNGFPTVFFADLDNDGLQEIIYVTMDGEISVYRVDGSSYFASLEGFFAAVPGFISDNIPLVFCGDFNVDGQAEMIVVMGNGAYIFNTHNGIEPDWVAKSKIVSLTGIMGACMADFDGDSLPELGLVGRETAHEIVYTAIVKPDGTYLPGFPKYLDRVQHLVNYPAAADLDSDGKAELIFAISSTDAGEIWVIRSDGTTLERPDGPGDSWLASVPGTVGAPSIADIDGDGLLDILVRAGNFLPGAYYERIYAFDLSGRVLNNWPVYTFSSPMKTYYRLYIPSIINLGNGKDTLNADLLATSDDTLIYAWKLPVPYDTSRIAWGQFAHDSRHTGILPPKFKKTAPSCPNLSPPTPAGLSLQQNYPNPFNSSTTIKFRMIKKDQVDLEIYNILGQRITTVWSGELPPGEHEVIWDGRNNSGHLVASGIYFCRLTTSAGAVSKKMLFLK